MSEDVTRLPKWAQHRIATLTRDRDSAQTELRTLGAPPVHRPGAVTVKTMSMNDEERALPDWEHVYFWIDDRRYVEVSHGRFNQIEKAGSFVRVRGESQLILEPEVSNGIRVRVGEK